ncbi:MAG: hypothetical protein AAF597_09770 [Bacteroidota bacterium]
MKRITLLAACFVFLSLGCGGDMEVNPIAQIGRADGWLLASITSDMETQVDAAIAALTDEQIDNDPRSRENIEAEYETAVRRTTVVDACDQDDLFFFFNTGVFRLISSGVACAAGSDANPLSEYQDLSYSVNSEATELTIRTNGGVFRDRFTFVEITPDRLVFEGPRVIRDSLFNDLTYQIRYDLIANQ